ncbi:glycosylated lysosomal membrane protein B-like [Xenia sp. Carnegie-2017]|uniref:glycosylated lysosomal membrane protein B-like n=1 Tax=Xenia sp. Carnegie-2017 TaxID=2897299 RepID=UPI001F04DDDE|nr:glycosylated lysosomal membrane protein B-like [Xenia sp. Carnegie-2017]
MAALRRCWIFFLKFHLMLSISDAINRKLSIQEFKCPPSNCSQETSLVWVKAKADDNTTIHYLWTTYPVPTIVVAYTTTHRDVKLHLNWEKMVNTSTRDSSLRFEPPVKYSFGFSIPIIYEYNDVHDKAVIQGNKHVVKHAFAKSTKWKVKRDDSKGKVKFTTANNSIILVFVASTSPGREKKLPCEKYTADSCRFSLTMDHVKVATNNTRFAVEINYIYEGDKKPDMAKKRLFDDEYSPGVFEIVYGKVSSVNGTAYAQWKPIAYTNPELGRKVQTKAIASSFKIVKRSWNIGDALIGSHQVYGVNLSFGVTKDGFYQKNHYLTWSGIVGYGKPATETMSFLVILIISIGLGLPIAIIVFGGTYLQIRKRCCKSNRGISYAQIN